MSQNIDKAPIKIIDLGSILLCLLHFAKICFNFIFQQNVVKILIFFQFVDHVEEIVVHIEFAWDYLLALNICAVEVSVLATHKQGLIIYLMQPLLVLFVSQLSNTIFKVPHQYVLRLPIISNRLQKIWKQIRISLLDLLGETFQGLHVAIEKDTVQADQVNRNGFFPTHEYFDELGDLFTIILQRHFERFWNFKFLCDGVLRELNQILGVEIGNVFVDL